MKVFIRDVGEVEVRTKRLDDKTVDDWREYAVFDNDGRHVGNVATTWLNHGGWQWSALGWTHGFSTRKEAIRALLESHYGLREKQDGQVIRS